MPNLRTTNTDYDRSVDYFFWRDKSQNQKLDNSRFTFHTFVLLDLEVNKCYALDFLPSFSPLQLWVIRIGKKKT